MYLIWLWIVAVVVILVVVSMMFRIVVSINEVHILQKNKKSISYGKDQPSGNVYYNRPSWFPFIGLSRIVLPVSNFELPIDEYEAYDKDKVPFSVDVVGFFRISDPIKAAQRISSFDELKKQLNSVLNGAIRWVLAGKDIIEIMENRNAISEAFTKDVENQLTNWGLEIF